MNNCPVCCSNASAKLDEISLATVCKYYQDSLSIDVSNLLKNGGPPIQLRHCGKCDLRWFAPAPSGDPQFYEGLQKHDWYYQDDKPEFFHAIKYVKSGDSILEVGCGKGALAVHLPSGVSYRGLEFNQDAVDKGRAAGLRIDMDPVDFHATKHPSAYDVVCHFQVLEHVTHPLAFLTACTALMKPGGLLVVAVPSEDSFLSIVEGGFLNMPPHHLTRWTDSALGFAMKEVGLKPIEIWHEPVAPFHQNWYRSTLGMFAMRHLLRQKSRLEANDLLSRVLRRMMRNRRIADTLSKIGSRNFPFRDRGHTVCIVGKKGGG